jgi:hypothetical protein
VPSAEASRPILPNRYLPRPARQMTTIATIEKIDEMVSTVMLAVAAAGGWFADVHRMPTTESESTIAVNTVIARRMALRAVI